MSFNLADFVAKVHAQTATHDAPDVTFAELGEMIALAIKGSEAKREMQDRDIMLHAMVRAQKAQTLSFTETDVLRAGLGEELLWREYSPLDMSYRFWIEPKREAPPHG